MSSRNGSHCRGECISGRNYWGLGGLGGRLGLCHGAWAVLSLTRYMGIQGIPRSSHYLMDGLLFFQRFFAFAAKDTQILITSHT